MLEPTATTSMSAIEPTSSNLMALRRKWKYSAAGAGSHDWRPQLCVDYSVSCPSASRFHCRAITSLVEQAHDGVIASQNAHDLLNRLGSDQFLRWQQPFDHQVRPGQPDNRLDKRLPSRVAGVLEKH